MTTAVSPRNLHPPRKPDEENDEERIYRGVSFATDDYVPWMVGRLKLGNADLSRMRSERRTRDPGTHLQRGGRGGNHRP